MAKAPKRTARQESDSFLLERLQAILVNAAKGQRSIVDDRQYTFGLSLFAAGLWLFSYMTPDWGFAALFWPQVVRSFAIMLCIVPSVGLALGNFEGAELRYASGLFNLMRNLGGAIGIALVNTWLQDATRLHVLRLSEALGQSARGAQELVAGLTRAIGQVVPDPHRAALAADAILARIVGRQALTLAFDDVFRLMAYLFLAGLVMVPFCKPPPRNGPTATPDIH